MNHVRISRRAKRVLAPLFGVGLVLFAAFLVHMVAHGGAAFPGGSDVGDAARDRYFVEEHGKHVEFTRASFRLSYFLGVASTASIICFLLAVLTFYCTGDL